MTEDQQPHQYDPRRVYVNGQAIALIASLVDGLRDDLRDAKNELRRDIAALGERTGRLEANETARESAVAIAAARRDGQLSVLRWAAAFIERNAKALVLVGTLAGAFLGAVVHRLTG